MKKTVKDFELRGKKVIIRCDLNVPMTNNIIEDDTRIKACVRTIKYVLNSSAKVIILSHLGKVKTEEDKEKNSLYPISIRLSKYLNRQVLFCNKSSGEEVKKMVDSLNDGEVLLLENTRFEDLDGERESNCDLKLAKFWASLGDIFINDAYATSHRNHASVTGIPKYLPSGIGFLVEKELKKIDNILDSDTHPFVVILGGKKVDDKIGLIKSLAEKSDKLLIGGAMSFTFLKAMGYNTGKSIISEGKEELCLNILDKYKNKIILPVDFVTEENSKVLTKKIEDFNNNDIGYDIGEKTIKLFQKKLEGAKRVVFNGPMGMFEDKRYNNGTKKILQALDKNKIKTLVGGGDTASAVSNLGFDNTFYHVSTGGGATMKYLEDRKLVGIEVIDNEEKQD
ncbi:MAG: phosphoglycerate kinase [Bacilli bacterium]